MCRNLPAYLCFTRRPQMLARGFRILPLHHNFRSKLAKMSSEVLCSTENIISAPSPKKPRMEAPRADVPLKVKKLSENAKMPSRGSAGAAGYDLSSAVDITVPARGKANVATDISIKLPPGTYGRVAPRSGLAWKHSIDTGAGVIDEDYRGPVGVILFNHSDVNFEVKKGDRIAQLILERIVTPEVVEVDELDDTARGAGGFGSTGVSAQ